SGRGGGAAAPVRTGRRIGVLALGIALVVPLALPALDGGLLGGRGGGNGKGSGGGTISAVNPLVSLKDNLNQPENREVMTYRTNAQDPRNLYLRILALDEFNGSEWRSSPRRLTDVPDRLPQPTGLGRDVAVTE
ncbi:transglutaminase, partial [Streptomyces sp. SID8455]|nr:transglutaminase [Streptomyces sp. SID8455]